MKKTRFNEWIFYPGMLFNVLIKWWGNLGRRSKPHEGLDLFLYRDKSGKHHKLNEEIKIPVIFEGEVVKIDNDYLGKSVFLRHEIFNSDERQLYTVYGHILPHKSIIIGESLLEGKIIGNISDIKGKRKSVPSHLHITIGWAPLTIPSEMLNWEMLGDRSIVTLLDPLDVIECNYSVLEQNV